MKTSRSILFVLLVFTLLNCSVENNLGRWKLDSESSISPPPFASLVVHISNLPHLNGYTVGTAIKLPGNRLLTASHLLPEHAFGIKVEQNGVIREGIPTMVALIEGQWVEYRVLVGGDRSDIKSNDWVVIEVEGMDLSIPEDIAVEYDFEREVKPGEIIYLVGYPEGKQEIVETRLVHLPEQLAVVPAGRSLFVEAYTGDVLHGMSGGAAVLWFPAEHRVVVLGNYRGIRRLEILGIELEGVHEIVRPPTHILN